MWQPSSSPSFSSSSSDSPTTFPSLASRSPSPQPDTALLSSSSFHSSSVAPAGLSSDSLSLHTSAASSNSSVPHPFPPVRQRSSHISDAITIHSSGPPTAAYGFASPTAAATTSFSSASSHSLLHRCLPSLFRLRPALAVVLVVVFVMLIVSAALTSVGLSSLPLVATVSPTSSVHPPLPHSNDRNILHANTPDGKCVNSVQGKELLVDSDGVVCERQDIDVESGCCAREMDRLSCRSCRHDLHCCHSYEYCISCCIGRQMAAPEDSLQTFGRCAAVCRTSSASIKHGNVYKHSYHHCYDKLGPVALNASAFSPPTPSPNPLATTPASLTAAPAAATASSSASALSVVAAELGYSCEATCANRSLSCHDSLLQLANSCDALNQHFPCTDCEHSDGGDQPAWVSDKAGSGYPEGRCLVQRADVSGGLTCEGRHEKTRRLCVCLREDMGEESAMEVGHFDGDDET